MEMRWMWMLPQTVQMRKGKWACFHVLLLAERPPRRCIWLTKYGDHRCRAIVCGCIEAVGNCLPATVVPQEALLGKLLRAVKTMCMIERLPSSHRKARGVAKGLHRALQALHPCLERARCDDGDTRWSEIEVLLGRLKLLAEAGEAH